MKETLNRIIKHPASIPSAVGVIAFGIGVGTGFILSRRIKPTIHEVPEQLSLDFTKADMDDITQNEVPINRVISLDNADVEEDTSALYLEDGEDLNYEQEPDPPVIASNVFAEDGDDWDYEQEMKDRTGDAPYIIHKDEFWASESGFTQTTLCYYAGDDIMCDEEDKPVYNHFGVTGELIFGKGSGDPNVVFIRNPEREAEYEILLHKGMYSTEVLGLEIEDNMRAEGIKHSAPKFKQER